MSFFVRQYKGTWFVDATWLSYPGPIPDDFPDEFDLDDFDGEPDLEGMARVQKWKDTLDRILSWETPETSTVNAQDAGTEQSK